MPSFKHDYDRLVNKARVELPGVSDAGIKQALFDVFHEFFTETSVWKEDIEVPIVVGTTAYDLFPEEPGEIVRLFTVTNENNTEQPAILSDDFSQVIIAYPVNVDQTYTVTVVKTVGLPITRDAMPEVPEWVLARWSTAIFDGLLGNLMMQKSKPYSDGQLAMYHLRRFRNALTVARAAGLRRNTFGKNVWAYPQNFRVRGQKSGSSGNDRSFN
jgi:hypothetical protein